MADTTKSYYSTEQYWTWRRRVAKAKRDLAHLLELALRCELTPEEKKRVFLFGSCVWGIPHWRSDVDLAIEDDGLDGGHAWKLWHKVFAIAERYFGEEQVDVCFMSELPDALRRYIRRYGRRLDNA